MNHPTRRPGTSARFALAAAIAAALPALPASAVDVIKANNTNALNLTTSWGGGVVPTALDVAVWNNTVAAANTVALGADLSFQGIRIANPGGLVTVTYAAGQTLTLGTSGIDMSAATQNLTLMSPAVANTAGTLAIGGNQIWNVAAARTLTLFANSNSANQRLSGSGNIEVTGGGIVNMNVGDAGSTTFTAGNGNDTYTGNWTITSGSVRSLRNGTHAWGQGTIFMNGGTIGQQQGNWSWTNAITLNTATTSTFDDFNSSGSTRALKLQGVLSGDGNLNINDTSNRMDANNGFILTGTNTLSGTVTIGASGNLRIGGVGGNDTTLGAGTTGTLGTASVSLNATATLTLSRNNTWTFGNNVSGGGVLNIGGAVSGAGTQVVTVSGTNTYTGATTVSLGRMDLTGSLTSATSVSSGASISGTGSTTGLLTFAGGTQLFLAGGGTTTGLTSNGVTFTAATAATFLTNPVAATTYDVLTYGAGTVTNPGNLSVNAHGTLNNTGTKFTFLADGAQTRTWNTTNGTWQNGVTTPWAEGDQKFYDLDNVIFNEPAAASTVTLTGTLLPASVTVNNTTNAYTFSSTGLIGGTASLAKSGNGTLTISTANTYSGGSTLTGGTLQAGGNNVFGTGTLALNGGRVSSDSATARSLNNAVTVGGDITLGDATNTGALTLSGTVNLGAATRQLTTDSAATLSGVISNGGLTKAGTGTLTLSNIGSTFGGNVAINAGQVTAIGASGNTNTVLGLASGSRTITVGSTGTLLLSGNNVFGGSAQTLANTIKVAVSSGGTLLTNAYNVVGNIDLNGGTLTATAGSNASYQTYEFNGSTITVGGAAASIISSTAPSNGGMHIAGGKTLTLDVGDAVAGTDLTISAALINGSGDRPGTGALLKTGAGTAVLSGTNTFTGSVTVNTGILQMGNGAAFGGANTAVTKVVVNSGGTVDFNGLSGAYGYTITGTGSAGQGALVNNGSGIGNGLLQSPNVTLGGNASIGGTGNWAMIASGWGANTLDLAGNTLTKTGANTVTLVSTTTTAGTVQVSQGTLAFGATEGGVGVTGSASAFTLDNTAGVSLSLTKDSSVGSLAGGGVTGGNVAIGNGVTLTAGALNTPTTFAGAISGSGGALTKTGTDTLTLTGNNTYTGATAINNGTLEVSGTGSLSGTASIAVNSGGTLLLSGTGNMLNDAAALTLNGGTTFLNGAASIDETVGTLTLSANSTIDFGALASGHTMRFADSSSPALVTAWAGSTLSIWNWSESFDHLYFGDGTGTGLQQSQLDSIKFYSDAGTTVLPFAPGFSGFTGSFGEVVPVPEPSSVFAGLGLLGLAAWRERRKDRAQRRGSRLAAAGNLVGTGVLS